MEDFESARPVSAGRVPPHSIEAEEYLLSCVFLDGADVLTRCTAAGVTPATFYLAAHRIDYEAALRLHAAGKTVDLATLAEELKTAGHLDTVGGYGHLTAISSRIPTTAQAPYFIEKLREIEQLRDLIRLGTAIVEDAHAYTGGGVDVAFRPQIEAMSRVLTASQATKTWAEIVAEAKAITTERMLMPSARKTPVFELRWGFSDFDRVFQPMDVGELVILAARPSVGKSSLMRQIAFSAADAGHSTLIETLEVTGVEAAINLAANISGIRSRRDLHTLHPADQKDLLRAFDTMLLPNLSVCDRDRTLVAILGRAKAFKQRYGLRLLCVDYLQLISDCKNPRHGQSTADAIGNVTSQLKNFAVNEACVVILLSQLNRAMERDGNREPVLADLRGSGNIEEDANRVIFLHRPDEYELGGMKFTQDVEDDITATPTFYTKAAQAKGRNHGTGAVSVSLKRETATFQQIRVPTPSSATARPVLPKEELV